MKRTSGLRFSQRATLLWSLAVVFLIGGMIAVNLYSPVAKAQDGGETPGSTPDPKGGPQGGDQPNGGRMSVSDSSYERFAKADSVTTLVRSRAQNSYRVMIHSMADRANAAKLGSVVEDYGSFVIISSSKKIDVARAGLDGAQLNTRVVLPAKTFEPVLDGSPNTIRSAGKISGGNYYVVQFAGTIKGEWIDSLRSVGVEFLQYVPNNAYFVYADGEALQKALNHSRVRWVGSFDAEDKVTGLLKDKITAARNGGQMRGESSLEMAGKNSAWFDVAVFSRADADDVAAKLQGNYGGAVKNVMTLSNNYFNMIRVALPLDRAAAVAEIPDVITIDAAGTPQAEDERAAQIVAGNYSSTTSISGPGYNPLTQFGVDGTGVTVSVGDDGISIPGNGGFYLTATNTINGPLRGATAGASGGHGHLNASIIAGSTPFGTLDPTGYVYGEGIAPGANIINIPFLKAGNTTTDAQLVDDTISTAGVNGVKGYISNNSWGNGTNSNVYDAFTATYDGFVRDASLAASVDPMVLVFSAGNCGQSPNNTACSSQSGLTRPKVAKNIISVASSENLRTELSASSANNMDDMSAFSSLGLAADGRIKPDIAAPGDVITGSRAGTDCSSVTSCFQANHSWSSGTSHAAPQIAGAAALFTQYWKNAHGTNPSPALVKAAILLTGQEMSGANAAAVVPNGREGWGRANMKFMLNTGVATMQLDQPTTFSNVGENVVYTGTVADSSKPLRITLAWTDPPGAANANPALVNNLDLTVTVGASTYKGNVFSGGNSTSGGTADILNNVENIRFPFGTPAGTPVTITVSATALNGDGVLGNADITDQSFSLVAYNFQTTAPSQAEQSDFDGDGKSDVAVYRPSTGVWYVIRSSDSTFSINTFGLPGDQIVPGDYDGDSKTDMAIYRPSSGLWYLQQSTAGLAIQSFGLSGDIPAQGDYDGDGKTDTAVFRPSTGIWYLNRSTAGFTGGSFGVSGDVPVQGDYDGDGKADLAVFRPSNNTWYIFGSTAGVSIYTWGSAGDIPAQGDYDGDGKFDPTVFRPSTGVWYVFGSTSGIAITNWGLNGDAPAPGDFDDDGKDDLAIFRPSNGLWFELRSAGGVGGANWGVAGDIPVQAGYIAR